MTAMQFQPSADFARQLDEQDELSAFRHRFVIDDPNLIYLDGNSLGRLPRRAADRLAQAVHQEWGRRLIRGWNDGWMDLPSRLGAKIAALVGARPDEVLVADSTSVNLFKLAVAALRARPNRRKIVSDVFNFPSDLYIFQGIIDLLNQGHRLELIPSSDGVSIEPADIRAAIDEETALVSLTHVAFKSAFRYDMAQVNAWARQAGALTLWDLSHSVGAVPLRLNEWGADMAVGCTYKYLNGGPGAPAFLYVRRDLQADLRQPIWGWLGADRPFDFSLTYTPGDSIHRFRVGTPPVLSMVAIEAGLEILLEAGIDRVWAKSARQTEYLIYLFDQRLAGLGFSLGSPRSPACRGSHVSLRHPDAYRITQAMIQAAPGPQVIPDFRTPDNIRLGIAPLYTTYTDIYRAINRIETIVTERLYEAYPATPQGVT